MTRSNETSVPEAPSLKFKKQVIHAERLEGNNVDEVKYEVAEELGIPLSKGDNGELTASQAGKIGGSIGGNMVKEMVKFSQEQMAKK